jgi:tol-pal system beta propeller repeat protein TolB
VIAVRTATVALGLALVSCGGAGSPTPGPIVFVSNPDGYGWKLMSVNADGSGLRRLTETDPDFAPGLSPDGKKVLLERTHEEESAACGLPACAQIWIADAGGGGETALTAKDEDAEGATWSPDGERIAFSKSDLERESDEITEADIYVMNPDGSDETRLTDLAGAETGPTWSPDGKQIAFSTSRGEEGDIYVMNSDGTELTRLTDLPSVEVEPVWSPDGERIAFSTEWVDRADVYVMKSDGSELRRLTDPAVGESSPAWSPDGDMLAFYRETDEGANIVIANEDGSDQREVVPPSEDEVSFSGPVWSPEAKQLAFTDQSTVWVVDSDGRNVRQAWSRPYTQPFVLDWAPSP